MCQPRLIKTVEMIMQKISSPFSFKSLTRLIREYETFLKALGILVSENI